MPAHIQSTSNYATPSSTTLGKAYDSNVTSGSLLIASISSYGISANQNVGSIGDDKGNTWVQIDAPGGWFGEANTDHQWFYAANATAGATTVTSTWSAAREYRALIISEYSDVATTTPLHKASTLAIQGTGSTDTDGLIVGTIVPTVDGCLIVSVCENQAENTTHTAGTGYTKTHTDSVQNQSIENLVQITAASIQGTWTWTNLQRPLGGVAAFLPPATSDTQTVAWWKV